MERGGSILASHPAAPGLVLGVPKNLFFDVAEINLRHWLEERGQGLENVD